MREPRRWSAPSAGWWAEPGLGRSMAGGSHWAIAIFPVRTRANWRFMTKRRPYLPDLPLGARRVLHTHHRPPIDRCPSPDGHGSARLHRGGGAQAVQAGAARSLVAEFGGAHPAEPRVYGTDAL